MYHELTKGEKKLAWQVMDKGLENEYLEGLRMAESVIRDWQSGTKSAKESYMDLYARLENIDDSIAKRHNEKGGSRYAEIIASQLRGGYLTEKDIEDFRDETKNFILIYSGKASPLE
jgi:hypothetical protein